MSSTCTSIFTKLFKVFFLKYLGGDYSKVDSGIEKVRQMK